MNDTRKNQMLNLNETIEMYEKILTECIIEREATIVNALGVIM